MSKGSRLKRQRMADVAKVDETGIITPIPVNKLKQGYSYWITGYFWRHDTIIVEPFCAVNNLGTWEITNLDKNDMDYWDALTLLKGEGTMLPFEGRVTAMDACEAIENQKVLLEGFAKFMTNDQLAEYVDNMGE